MKTQKYYWTVVILAVLFVFVIAADVAGFIGLFTGGGDAASTPEAAPVVVMDGPEKTEPAAPTAKM